MSPTLEREAGICVGGKYLLVKRLAAGGMGEVWVAKNQSTGANVAVKLCHGPIANEEAVARFRHEAHLGATLSHRGIVRVFDLVAEPDGTLVLVMELLRGETLEHFLGAKGPLPTNVAMAIALPVLAALSHAHDLGIVHRDVTPANIFLAVDPDGHVTPKLVDFGIAKLPASGIQTLEGRVLGTPRYMAPERIRAVGEVDGRNDLFSVGVILYEMLTGTSPFAASTPAGALAAVLETTVDPDPRIDPALWIELQRSLAKRPYERQASCREMAEALKAATGVTDSSLSEILYGLQLSRGPVTDDEFRGQLTKSVGGHSLDAGGTLWARRRGLARWLVAATLVASLAVAGAAGLRSSRSHSAAYAPSPGATRSAVEAPAFEPPSLATPTPPSAPTVAPSATTPAATVTPRRATRPPPRPKAVATTPGF